MHYLNLYQQLGELSIGHLRIGETRHAYGCTAAEQIVKVLTHAAKIIKEIAGTHFASGHFRSVLPRFTPEA